MAIEQFRGVSPQVNALCTLLIGAAFLLVALSRYISAVRKNKRKAVS